MLSLLRAKQSAGRLSLSARYGGANPCTHLNTSTASVKSIRSFAFSQWSWRRSGVMWSKSMTSKLVEQLHSSLTEAAEEDIEEYRPVSHYRSPDDWGQVTSPVTELDTERRIERSCLSTAKLVDTVFLTWELIDMSELRWIPRSWTAADGVTKSVPNTERSLWQLVKSTTCNWPEDLSLGRI